MQQIAVSSKRYLATQNNKVKAVSFQTRRTLIIMHGFIFLKVRRGFLCGFAGRWRWIQTVLPERVDVVPQGTARLWVSRGVAVFQPPAGHLHLAGWGLAWDQILCPVHKQLVRHFLFLFFNLQLKRLSRGSYFSLKAQQVKDMVLWPLDAI